MIDACEKDIGFMREALVLAANGCGATAPNPLVGCVLVKDAEIVGRGWHAFAGGPHAEVNAIADAGEAAAGSTAYVTLEPCNHKGKTGPCVDALIAVGVKEVVYALADPNPKAAGGAERLRRAGVTVRNGVCCAEAAKQNRAWLHRIAHHRPYVVAKTAMTIDGRIATKTGESKWITGAESRKAAHRLRAEADAIIVGAGTVIADDPALTARLDSGARYPLRIVLDSTARTSPGAKAYERSGKGAMLVTAEHVDRKRVNAFEKMGVEPLLIDSDNHGRPDLPVLLRVLGERGFNSVFVEGGGEVLGAFFDADLIDELNVFVAPKIFGGGRMAFNGAGVAALTDASRFQFDAPKQIGDDFWLHGVRRQGAS